MTTRARAVVLIANSIFFALATAVASFQLWPIYQDPRFITLAVGATVVGMALAILGAVFRWPTALVVVAAAASYLVIGVPLAVPDEAIGGVLPSLDGIRRLLSGTALGWKQLLTITLPVGDYRGLLVPALLLLLVSSVAGLTALLRSPRFGDLGLFGPVGVFLVAIAFGPDSADRPRTVTLALLGVCLVFLIWRRWYARRSAIARVLVAPTIVGAAPAVPPGPRAFDIRSFLSGIAIMIVAVSVGAGLSSAIAPAGARQVLRDAVDQPFDPRAYSSPLAGFRAYLQPERAGDLIFTVAGLQDGERIRIATLDSYDGIVFSAGSSLDDPASGSFTRVPYRLDQSGGDRQSLQVVIGDYTGVWMPTVGDLESVRFSGARASELTDAFYYNDESGTGADIAQFAPGDAYSLDAVIPTAPTPDQLAGLTPGPESVPVATVVPDEVERTLASYVDPSTSVGEQLVDMLAGLDQEGFVSHGLEGDVPSRSGHSADRITSLLTDQRMIGDAEQYSVTAALMARLIGFPSRVVFGFAPEVAPTGVTSVMGSSVSAWIEVDTEQFGWVTLDPTPDPRPIPDEQQEDPTVVAHPPSIVDRPTEDQPSIDEQSTPESSQDEQPSVPEWLAALLVVARIVGWIALALGLVFSPFLAVIAAKARRRRRRRRAANAVERISGGWREYRDAVLDHGFTPPPMATRSEVAATVGSARASVLAAVADRAVFSPGGAEDAEADRVWKAVEELRHDLDRGLGRRERIAARLSLHSFEGSRWIRSLLRRGGT